jgi:hypothetical protein
MDPYLTEELLLVPEEPDPVDVHVDGNLQGGLDVQTGCVSGYGAST